MAKLGSERRPAVMHVQTAERAAEITEFCEQRGWKVIVGVEPDKPENLVDLDRLMHRDEPVRSAPPIGRNSPCPCGSGKKYKRCCMAKDEIRRRSAPGSVPSGSRVVERDGRSLLVSGGLGDEELDVAADYFARKDRGEGPANQIAEFAQPLLDAAGDDPEMFEKAFGLGCLLWNVAIIDDDDARAEALDKLMDTAKTDQGRGEFMATAQEMIERHRRMFPEMHGQPKKR